MHHKKNQGQRNDKIRNVRAFVSAYLKSDAGKAALNRGPIRVRDEDGKFKTVFRTSQMAEAFQQAIQ